MKKLILIVFLCLNVFGAEKIEISKNIVNLEIDENNSIFNIKDVLVLDKRGVPYSSSRIIYEIRFKGNNTATLSYSELETYNKLIELFKSYNMQ